MKRPHSPAFGILVDRLRMATAAELNYLRLTGLSEILREKAAAESPPGYQDGTPVPRGQPGNRAPAKFKPQRTE